ncbi:uncharacterized protein [Dermacentor andersoni]|uniref:uncharacterized protein n=1 Tax=Dermacentor andersoni TaxID=34620 RepID=UPI0024175F5F|nr:uncharacterized protein LOC129381845 [Dermacentor andersoni]
MTRAAIAEPIGDRRCRRVLEKQQQFSPELDGMVRRRGKRWALPKLGNKQKCHLGTEKSASTKETLPSPAVVEVDGSLQPADGGSVERHGSAASLHPPEPVHDIRRFEEEMNYNYAVWQAETAGVCLMSFLVILSGLALLCLLMLSMRDQKGLSAVVSNIVGAAYPPRHKGAQ